MRGCDTPPAPAAAHAVAGIGGGCAAAARGLAVVVCGRAAATVRAVDQAACLTDNKAARGCIDGVGAVERSILLCRRLC